MLNKEKLIEERKQKKLDIDTEAALLIIGLIEIRESVDRYIEQRIKSDKVLEGVLKDIYNSIQESGSQN